MNQIHCAAPGLHESIPGLAPFTQLLTKSGKQQDRQAKYIWAAGKDLLAAQPVQEAQKLGKLEQKWEADDNQSKFFRHHLLSGLLQPGVSDQLSGVGSHSPNPPVLGGCFLNSNIHEGSSHNTREILKYHLLQAFFARKTEERQLTFQIQTKDSYTFSCSTQISPENARKINAVYTLHITPVVSLKEKHCIYVIFCPRRTVASLKIKPYSLFSYTVHHFNFNPQIP